MTSASHAIAEKAGYPGSKQKSPQISQEIPSRIHVVYSLLKVPATV